MPVGPCIAAGVRLTTTCTSGSSSSSAAVQARGRPCSPASAGAPARRGGGPPRRCLGAGGGGRAPPPVRRPSVALGQLVVALAGVAAEPGRDLGSEQGHDQAVLVGGPGAAVQAQEGGAG